MHLSLLSHHFLKRTGRLVLLVRYESLTVFLTLLLNAQYLIIGALTFQEGKLFLQSVQVLKIGRYAGPPVLLPQIRNDFLDPCASLARQELCLLTQSLDQIDVWDAGLHVKDDKFWCIGPLIHHLELL